MSSLPRTALVIGALVASLSGAEAGGRSTLETYPILAAKARTAVADSNTPGPSPAAVPAQGAMPPAKPAAKPDSDARTNRRARRSRLAQVTKAVSPARAETPAAPVAGASAPQESTFAKGPVPDGKAAELASEAGSDAKRAGQAPADQVASGTAALPPGQERAARTPAETLAKAGAPQEVGAPSLATLIAKHAKENGIPFGLAQAVVRIESRGNIRASNGGALGLMQIKAGTARAAGFSGGTAGLFDAETNLHFGMKILADAYRDTGGNVCRTLMKYQSGHLATHMTRANRAYCSKARAVMAGA